jgi:uncharacterized protein YhdP
VVGALVIAGCGGGGDSSGPASGGTADPHAKSAAQAYLNAYAARKPRAICALLTPKVRRQLADNKGSCVKTVAFSLKGQKFGRLTVAGARASDGNAIATITGSQRQIRLQSVSGAWKVYDGGT